MKPGIDVPCPRCGRVVRTMGVSDKLYRHLDPETDDWCTQEPKNINDLMIELLDAVSEERDVLGDLADLYLEFGERLRARWDRQIQATEKSSELIKRVTHALRVDDKT